MYLKELSLDFYNNNYVPSPAGKKGMSTFFSFGEKEVKLDRLSPEFLQKLSIYINTVDYVKETLASVVDTVVDLIEKDSIKEKIEFDREEDLAIGKSNINP